jgi:hypothetical protein
MRKSEFLPQLRTAVCASAEATLAATEQTTEGCPYLEYWFDYYNQRDAAHVERALRRYAPEARRATTARDYIPIVAERVRQGVQRWASTGDVTGVPQELLSAMPGGSLLRALGGLTSGIAGAAAGVVRGIGSGLATVGGLFFKGRSGGPRETGDPKEIQAQLGPGHPLEARFQSRMASALNADFSRVRVHTDAQAAQLSGDLNARAFTIGEHVAFSAGEYRPGTLLGDALIAHELAHVVQQSCAGLFSAPMARKSSAHSALETDADRFAVSAAVSLWGRINGLSRRVAASAIPRLRSGLQLQRCGASLPPLRDPRVVVGESQAFEQQAVADLQQRGLSLARGTRDRAQGLAIASAEVGITSDLQRALRWLREIYQQELEDAGADTRRQRQAQQRFEQQVQRLRESYMLQFELTRRYGVTFTVGRTHEFQTTPPRERWRVQAWSREEMETVDHILRTVPSQYLRSFRTRVREIQREPFNGGAADWDESTGRLTLYNRAFERPEEMRRIILHEIGHSTVQGRTAGGFAHLPPADWMRLSDWQCFTRGSLASALGLRDAVAERQALERLDENARLVQQYARPIPIDTPSGRRWVVHDKYESAFPPSRFFHFSDRHRNEFVSGYARSHPAEDLAESFAHYLSSPDRTRDVLDVGREGVTDKWDYLVQHYPSRLRESE